ncbi:MAG: diguanylate cyclase [Campylobacterota bacterium]|nr:diguanylate cyclase [Campylobacterota bacterium]
MKKHIALLIFIAVLIVSLGVLNHYFLVNKDKEIANLNKESMNLAKTSYNSIFNTYRLTAQAHHTSLQNNTKALQILKKFKYEKDENEKTFLRGQLFRLLAKKYKTLKKLGIRQFHFHTHKGESLLRFHKPYKSGDSLIGIRKSIEYVNREHRAFFGFEGGKIFPGFRFVFPILDKGEHLGSIEFSLPFEVIEKQLQSVLPIIGYQLHLDHSVSYDLVFDSFRSFFSPSPLISNHYIENPIISDLEVKLRSNQVIQELISNLKPLVPSNDIGQTKDFTLYLISQERGFRANFISIKELHGNHTAFLVSYYRFDELIDIENKYFTYQVLTYIIAIIILLLGYIINRQLNIIMTKNSNIQQLIDTQDNIVILSDGQQINFANLKFLNFFGFKNIEEFKKHHKCICDNFIKNDKFFHLGKLKEDQNWIDAIQTLPASKRMVSIYSKSATTHAFSVTVNKFDDDFSVISFTDISQTMQEYLQLEEKVLHDKLTGAFNREYFDQNYQRLLAQYSTEHSYFALALLDIDHFKKVNDNYGHDIGDAVLIHFVQTVERFSRVDDILIRWGGEEFIMVLQVHSQNDLQKALEHIRKVIELETFSKIDTISCSIGGTLYHEGEAIKDTIKRVDEALYNAKSTGRNRVVIY